MHETPRLDPQHGDYRVEHRPLIEALRQEDQNFMVTLSYQQAYASLGYRQPQPWGPHTISKTSKQTHNYY